MLEKVRRRGMTGERLLIQTELAIIHSSQFNGYQDPVILELKETLLYLKVTHTTNNFC